MKKTEIVKLFLVIRVDHKNFEISDERRDLWYEALKDVTYEQAKKNYVIHLSESDYEPKPSNIKRYDPEVNVNYKKMYLDTQTYLQDLEVRQKLAIDCPSHLSQKRLTGETDA